VGAEEDGQEGCSQGSSLDRDRDRLMPSEGACKCGQLVSSDELAIGCDTCRRLHHPVCVGLLDQFESWAGWVCESCPRYRTRRVRVVVSSSTRKVKFTGLTQNSQVEPVVLTENPYKSLKVDPDSGLPL
jgi:hypothetical protein